MTPLDLPMDISDVPNDVLVLRYFRAEDLCVPEGSWPQFIAWLDDNLSDADLDAVADYMFHMDWFGDWYWTAKALAVLRPFYNDWLKLFG